MVDVAVSEAEGYATKEMDFLRTGLYADRLRSWNVDLTGFRVLDLGAGPGTWELALAEFGPERIVWHDKSGVFRDIAKRLHREAGLEHIEYRLGDLLDLDYPDASFDLVVCRLALYYARDEWRALEEMARIVKPHGFVYIEAHNFRWTWKRPTAREIWKYPAVLAAPYLALITRRKLIRTTLCVEWFVRRRLAKYGFQPIWREESESRATFRRLFKR